MGVIATMNMMKMMMMMMMMMMIMMMMIMMMIHNDDAKADANDAGCLPRGSLRPQVYGYQNNLKPSGCHEYSHSARQTDWMALAAKLNSVAHGHIHELMGGSWFHSYAYTNHRQYTQNILTFAHSVGGAGEGEGGKGDDQGWWWR
jgi:hypothetical protein